ncbi:MULTISPECIES: hypothetical protein [Streptomyces]|uniref:Uncharacterized protein n=1 Tax=Streptomyces doudnae TaxID=3075536 RepID=A0ABD5EVC2_9ACTN|nr:MULTISPECIES: hypothetical protein [unclassified Streptomyces]MDT0438677.1 hypothetical protein [Streptomyces sp. DSM 41981]MYQ62021.1 hypothetical protein [Streptomyces sp. SID4950]SCD28633.1 hypothetical protein GA0115242_10073 [Streptomyces sp. SolWspMP-5a-2]
MPDAEQLYAVLSVGGGVEVVALSVLEQRCAAGRQGIILAGADDLPEELFEPLRQSVHDGAAQTEGTGVWAPEVNDPCDATFGSSLSAAEGERLLVRLCEGRADTSRALRTLALARSAADLRDLEASGYDERGPRSSVPWPVWDGLLAMEQLRLGPFAPVSDDRWSSGSGLPVGVLASVQAYTSDAAGRFEGRAHSPGCAHRRPEPGVGRYDEMVTIEELMGNQGFDPCSKCGGYAVRRLTDAQVAYYRAAHRLHAVARLVGSLPRRRTLSSEDVTRALHELDDLNACTDAAWFPAREQAHQWRRRAGDLGRELQKLNADAPGT